MFYNNNYNTIDLILNGCMCLMICIAVVFGHGLWRLRRSERAKGRRYEMSHLNHVLLQAGFTVSKAAEELCITEAKLEGYFSGKALMPKTTRLAIQYLIEDRRREKETEEYLRALWARGSAASSEKPKLRVIQGGRHAVKRLEVASEADPRIGPAA